MSLAGSMNELRGKCDGKVLGKWAQLVHMGAGKGVFGCQEQGTGNKKVA
jgi:hypothetical protein